MVLSAALAFSTFLARDQLGDEIRSRYIAVDEAKRIFILGFEDIYSSYWTEQAVAEASVIGTMPQKADEGKVAPPRFFDFSCRTDGRDIARLTQQVSETNYFLQSIPLSRYLQIRGANLAASVADLQQRCATYGRELKTAMFNPGQEWVVKMLFPVRMKLLNRHEMLAWFNRYKETSSKGLPFEGPGVDPRISVYADQHGLVYIIKNIPKMEIESSRLFSDTINLADNQQKERAIHLSIVKYLGLALATLAAVFACFVELYHPEDNIATIGDPAV